MQSELFDLLRTVLKARGLTYAALAKRLDLSEPTIKRIFAERDCKLSRMTAICSVLDLTLDDLVAEANRVEVTPVSLGDRIEARLADDRPAFHLFLLLLDGMTSEAIQNHYGLDDLALFAIGRRLEKLSLVEVMPGGRLRLNMQGPVEFRRDGPLHRTLLDLNMNFLRATYLDQYTEHSAFLTQSRRVSAKTARHMLTQLRALRAELSDLARKDQLTQPDAALHSYKLSLAWSPVAFSELLDLDAD
ncbi:helix-turn-helix transcriptional regulator [Gymnodinialimonas sp. 2305UL16-5]|uniref:helix-turn-helix domain-containing protein n=1 Tax=Gymnodinialimonas mytili TaxID=3126503 RepID=UPI0030A44CBD